MTLNFFKLKQCFLVTLKVATVSSQEKVSSTTLKKEAVIQFSAATVAFI